MAQNLRCNLTVDYQTTLKKQVEFSGIGLHSGKMTRVRLYPAKFDTGIVFVRKDVTPSIMIRALNSYVIDSKLSTTLGREKASVATVEHLMSALWGMGVDNILIEVEGSEVPILDGSSYPFIKAFQKVGLVLQDKPRPYFVVTKPISIIQGDRYCYLMPHKSQRLSCSIEFDHPLIKKQLFDINLSPKEYVHKICQARTFGFVKDFEKLKNMGLISGGSLENAIVLDDITVLNSGGLRYRDEFVRHKVLDLIGDMALMGVRILGHMVAHKSGHQLHHQLIRKTLKEECGYIRGISEEPEVMQQFLMSLQAVSA